LKDISKHYEGKIYRNAGNRDVLDQVKGEGISVLDVGCGAGDNAFILKQRGYKVTGITISEAEANLARAICDVVLVANIETDDLSFPEKFDVIILSHVCEHLVDPIASLNKLARLLKDDGRIVIAVPNMAYYKNRLRILKGDWSRDESGPFDKTHLQFYSFDNIDLIFDNEVFSMISVTPGLLAIPLWPLRSLVPSFSRTVDVKIGSLFPNLFAQQTIILLGLKK